VAVRARARPAARAAHGERLAGIVARERQLIADVSHELKTPLARLRVAIELAAEDDDPAAVHALLADMGGDLDELDGLVSTLLDSARLDVLLAEVDRPSVRREPVDLVEASRAALDRLRRRDPAIEAALIGGPVTVEGDGGLIGRLLDNLLVNAARHGGARRGR
jgi:signal transduction histidine kinase